MEMEMFSFYGGIEFLSIIFFTIDLLKPSNRGPIVK